MQETQIKQRRFGRLVIVRQAPSDNGRRFIVRCNCGTEKNVLSRHLMSGATQSCGCLQKEITASNNFRHGGSLRDNEEAEYLVYKGMKQRCADPAHVGYSRYGGRGIRVCDRWSFGEGGKSGYQCFLADMGKRPSSAHSLDRFPDGDGNYEPGNVRWASDTDQARNKRTSVHVVLKGVSLPLAEACALYGVQSSTAHWRLKRGWPPDEAFGLRPHQN
jgi:hypothetical protein